MSCEIRLGTDTGSQQMGSLLNRIVKVFHGLVGPGMSAAPPGNYFFTSPIITRPVPVRKRAHLRRDWAADLVAFKSVSRTEIARKP